MPQKIKMNQKDTMTFEEGFDQFLLDCKARNLREGTIRHYTMQIKQIWKYIPRETYMACFFFLRFLSVHYMTFKTFTRGFL